MNPIVVSLPGNETLATALADGLSAETGTVQLRQFPDGETYLRVVGAVAGRDAVIACTLDRPDDKLVRLYLLASTLRSMGASRVVLVAPYLAYMRQDKIFNEGECVSATHVARWLSGFLDGLVTVDPHLHRIRALSEIYRIPTLVVPAAPDIGRWIASAVAQPLLIGPDEESGTWVQQTAHAAGCHYLILKKLRLGDHEVRISIPGIQGFMEYTPVVMDDIISTGGTMIETVRKLHGLGFAAPVCIGVHAIFADDAYELLRHAGAERILSCNTVAHSSNTIDLQRRLAVATWEFLADLPTPK